MYNITTKIYFARSADCTLHQVGMQCTAARAPRCPWPWRRWKRGVRQEPRRFITLSIKSFF